MHRHTFAHTELCQNSGTITDVWPSTYQIGNKLFWQCFSLNYSKHHCPKDFLFFSSKIAWKPSEKQIPTLHSCLACDYVIECWSPPQYSFTSQAPYSEHDHFVFIYSFIFLVQKQGLTLYAWRTSRLPSNLQWLPLLLPIWVGITGRYYTWLTILQQRMMPQNKPKGCQAGLEVSFPAVLSPIQHSFDGTKSGRDSDVTLRVKQLICLDLSFPKEKLIGSLLASSFHLPSALLPSFTPIILP